MGILRHIKKKRPEAIEAKLKLMVQWETTNLNLHYQ
jgi:hypothetical protein